MLDSSSQACFAYHHLCIRLFGLLLYMDVRWGIRPNAGGGGMLPGSDLGSDSRVSCSALPRTPRMCL